MDEPKAYLASPVAGSVAEQAGLRGGELVVSAGLGEGDFEPVRSFEDLRWTLTRGALDGQNVRLLLQPERGSTPREVLLRIDQLDVREADVQLYRRIGITAPWTRPVLGEVVPGGAAARAGLRAGDVVLRLGSAAVVDGVQLRELIRASVQAGQPLTQVWRIERDGQPRDLEVTPEVAQEAGGAVGRVGAYVARRPRW